MGREVEFECKMASFEGESARVIDKFNGENFSLWKFKMEMVLASMDLWEIVEGSEEAPPSDADPKVIKDYQRRVKKAMSTIRINLVDSQLHHIKRCRGPAEAWKKLCNVACWNYLIHVKCHFMRGHVLGCS